MAAARSVAARAAALVLAALPPAARGHGYIYYPPLRGGAEPGPNNGHCPHCLGGLTPLRTCGKPQFLDFADGPVTQLQAGQQVEIEIRVTAHHKGHFQFSLCDQTINSSMGGYANEEACLNQHTLQRVRPELIHGDCGVNDHRGDCQPIDEANPGFWYLPPPGAGSGVQEAGSDWEDSEYVNPYDPSLQQVPARSDRSASPAFLTYKFHYWIPEDVTCTKCTLQFRWKTANSCTPHPDAYRCYFQRLANLGWNAQDWCSGACSFQGTCPDPQGPEVLCGEEFKNCVDLEIAGVATTTPAPVAPTSATATPTPTTTPAPAPTSATATPTTTAPATSPTTSPSGTACVLQEDCTKNAWCHLSLDNWCNHNFNICPVPHCRYD